MLLSGLPFNRTDVSMNFKLTITTLCSLMVTGYAFAHHSFAPYDIRNPIEITGVTEDFVYRRPHPMLTFLDDGNVEWEIEVPLRFWDQAAIAQDAIKPGDELMVRGFPARNGDPEMAMAGFELNGTYYSVHEEIGQSSGNEAADAIESGEPLESVLERYSEPE
jgi:hypothetical protein